MDKHYIYKIVCFPTGKVYIGRSKSPKVRMFNHFAHLKRNRHFNRHLQSAYNQWGRDCFFFEVIEKNIPDELIAERETYWITYFDSCENGYNRNYGGNDIGKPSTKSCQWNGIKYPSITEAAEALGIEGSTMSHRVKRGFICDEDLRLCDRRKPTIWNGIEYKSITALAKARGVSKTKVQWQLKKGYTCDADLPLARECPVVWNGVKYATLAEASKALGITAGTVKQRVQKGYTNDNDVKPYRQQCEIDGVVYDSLKSAASALKLSRHQVAYKVYGSKLKPRI